MGSKRRLLPVLAAACACPLALAVTFSAPMETTRWQVDASVFACKLYQPVKLYGEAVFMHRAGEDQHFYLHERNRQLASGEAALMARSPRWRRLGEAQQIGPVAVESGERPVELDWGQSQRLVEQLQAGRQLVFSTGGWYGEGPEVNVVLEPIRFRAAFDEFQQCLANLLPANYDQIRRSSIGFEGGEVEFPDDERTELNHLIRYVLADEHVTELVVDGHSDGAGLRAENLALSKERAEFVVDYLTERGVPRDLITMRWHGERYPIASNRTAAGRAENRRVTIRVDRFEPGPNVMAKNDS